MISRIHRRAAVAVAALTVLTTTACAGQTNAIVAPPGTVPTPCGTVSIAVNPWVGYQANVAVVSYLLENELDCTVVEKELTEEDSWKGLAAGEIDVILENWGHDELKKKYIDELKVAVEHGITGNTGRIGWYVPPWMVKQYPDITDWKKLNDRVDLFRTAESGDKGQLLGGDESYLTNDRALIKNLKLNYQVVYAGSEEALIKAFDRAEKEREPLIGYFYAPQWLLSDVKLVRVPLPEYKPSCSTEPEEIACDYQPYFLDKIASKKFASSGSPAADLIKNFQWTNDDQNSVARDITVAKRSRDSAAKRWLDAHPAEWQKWLPTR